MYSLADRVGCGGESLGKSLCLPPVTVCIPFVAVVGVELTPAACRTGRPPHSLLVFSYHPA